MAKKCFAVTGGLGFIGSHVVQKLLADGYAVKAIDVIPIEASVYADPLKGHGNFCYCMADICSLRDLRRCFEGVDGVFHFGAYSKIKLCLENPALASMVNVGGTYNVLSAARECGVRRIVYAASSSAYGNAGKIPFSENMPPKPEGPYAVTKYLGEVLCRGFSEWYGLETISLRFFNVYGSIPAISGFADCPSVVEVFLKLKKNSQPLNLVGDGKQSRDFIHVSDAADASAKAMLSGNAMLGKIVNIGSGEKHSVAEIAEWIGGPTINAPSRYEEAPETLADISQAESLLSWEPKIKLREWIRKQSVLSQSNKRRAG